MEQFKIIIVEDVALELKGTEGIIRNDIPEAQIIGTANNEMTYWKLIKKQLPDLVLLDLGLGGSTTVGVEICRQTKELYPNVKVLIFTGEILNEKLWVDVKDKRYMIEKLQPEFGVLAGIDRSLSCDSRSVKIMSFLQF